jgi:hypothetical protein
MALAQSTNKSPAGEIGEFTSCVFEGSVALYFTWLEFALHAIE